MGAGLPGGGEGGHWGLRSAEGAPGGAQIELVLVCHVPGPFPLTLTALSEHTDTGAQPRLTVACQGALTAVWLHPGPRVTLARHPREHLAGLRLGPSAVGGQVCAVCQAPVTRLSSPLSRGGGVT